MDNQIWHSAFLYDIRLDQNYFFNITINFGIHSNSLKFLPACGSGQKPHFNPSAFG